MTHENLADYNPAHYTSDRTFGLTFAGFFAALALLPALRWHPTRWWALALAAWFALCAWLRPAWLKGLNRLWMRFGTLLSRITNPIILGALFYLVFTPVGFLRRLFGSDPLRVRLDPSAASYWIERAAAPSSMDLQF